MANYTDLMSLFDDIGDAINDKGVSGQFYPNQMATAIRSIPDFTPSGNFAITANGIYDVTDYATASVNITTGIDHGVFITEEDDPAGGKIMYVTGVDLSQDTVDAAHLVSGYTAHDRSGNAITGTFGGIELNNQAKSITPSTSQQIVSPDSGYTGLSSVTVAAIPSQFKNTSDADAVAANILYDKTAYNSTGKITGTMPNNGATGGTISTQNGTYTIPAGYTSGGTVTATLPTQTLPTSAAANATSGYTSKATISRSTSDQYINIPTGYNSAGAYYKINAVANGSATGPSSVSGTSASVSTGTNTLTLTKTGVSTTPTVSAGYVSSATASTATVTLTASVTTKAAATITPGTTNQTIASGTYLTGTQTIAGDANLVSSNIISGKSIFGVNGGVVINKYYTGSTAPSSSLGNNGDIYFQN